MFFLAVSQLHGALYILVESFENFSEIIPALDERMLRGEVEKVAHTD
jgi:hypothetical protein